MRVQKSLTFLIWLTGILLVLFAPARVDAQSPSGAGLAANCYICHGQEGASASAIPKLTGLSGAAIAAAMRDARAGTKPGTIMPRIAKGYTDAQIDAIAAYFDRKK